MKNIRVIMIIIFFVLVLLNILCYFHTMDEVLINIGKKTISLQTVYMLPLFILLELFCAMLTVNKSGSVLPILITAVVMILNLWYISASLIG